MAEESIAGKIMFCPKLVSGHSWNSAMSKCDPDDLARLTPPDFQAKVEHGTPKDEEVEIYV